MSPFFLSVGKSDADEPCVYRNGVFQMATASDSNLYLKNNQLYIMPTLTSDSIGSDSVFDGYTFDLGDACTTDNTTACSVTSDSSTDTVVQPVQSARITTKSSYSIKYGKVTVKAKLPLGDWLWPSITMLPVENTYGDGYLSGQIDVSLPLLPSFPFPCLAFSSPF